MRRLLPGFLLIVLLIGGCGKANNSGPRARSAGEYQLDLSQVQVVSPEKAAPDTIGIMFCVDVSPSMNDRVGGDRKIDVSRQAMNQVMAQIEKFAREHPEKKIHVGLIAFSGHAQVVRPLEPFNRASLERAVSSLRTGNATAIGDAMVLGLQELLAANVSSRALIVLTDGENNRGVRPEWVVRAVRSNQNTQQAPTDDVKLFLLAFDIDAHVFAGVKDAGAAVLESRDKNSLEGIMSQTVDEVLLEKPR